MPHRATIEPCTGHTARGPEFGEARTVRANFNGRGPFGRSLDVPVGGGVTAVTTGGVLLDDTDLPLLSRITNEATGNSALVGVVERWDQPPVAPFLVVTLAQLVA